MAIKTQENNANVSEFIRSIGNEKKEADAFELLALMEKVTGKSAKMWGESIIGFGKYTYQNTSCGGQWPVTGFSPRKSALSVYIMPGFEAFNAELEKLGKHKLGKSCLYINKLADVDLDVLAAIVSQSIAMMNDRYECE